MFESEGLEALLAHQRELEQHVEGIDVIGVRNGGVELAERVSRHLASNPYGIEISSLAIYPTSNAWRLDGYLGESISSGAVPAATTRSEFASSPLLRLQGAPSPQRVAILVDDWEHMGGTFKGCKEDLVALGYDSRKIYTFTPYNSDGGGGLHHAPGVRMAKHLLPEPVNLRKLAYRFLA